jgi:general secretion pathway protein F
MPISPAGDLPGRLSRSPVAGARRGRFSLRQFSQELAVLLRAGIPLLEALRGLREKEASAYAAGLLDALLAQLESGQPLSVALRSRSDAFDALFVAIIASSERTGHMERGLREHAAYLAWVERLRDKLVSASIYPATLIVAGGSVLLFLLLFVVPRFAGILESTGGNLPAASRILIEVGRIGGDHPWLGLGAVAAVVCLLVLLWRAAGVAEAIRERLWRLPLLGPKLRLLALARFYRTASMLLGAGVAAVAALQTTRGVIAAPLRPGLDAAIESIRRGERLSSAFEQHDLATPVSLRMMLVGERSGELGPMLGEAAAFYDEELAQLTELVTRIVNPALMLIMGVVIGAVIVLMYLPIFQLVEQVQ